MVDLEDDDRLPRKKIKAAGYALHRLQIKKARGKRKGKENGDGGGGEGVPMLISCRRWR